MSTSEKRRNIPEMFMRANSKYAKGAAESRRGVAAMRRLLWAGGTMLAVCCLAATVAPPALAVVLVNQPPSRVCVGKTIQVGVWYQEFSGGSRAYRLDVYDPHGKRVLYKHGKAPSSAWAFWNVRAKLAGKYRTVYGTRYDGAWRAYRVSTRSHHC